MNRRNFLALGGLGLAGFALDPERLLWTPGKRIFIPPAGGWHTDRLYARIYGQEILRASQELLHLSRQLEWNKDIVASIEPYEKGAYRTTEPMYVTESQQLTHYEIVDGRKQVLYRGDLRQMATVQPGDSVHFQFDVYPDYVFSKA